MNTPLLTQWQRLIFPPAGIPIKAGEQLRGGNRYPDVTGGTEGVRRKCGNSALYRTARPAYWSLIAACIQADQHHGRQAGTGHQGRRSGSVRD